MPNILGVGLTGLNAAQVGLITTGHNIANAATPGFSRQSVDQAANTPQMETFGALGRGAALVGVKRAYSNFAAGQVLTAEARATELGAYGAQVNQLGELFGDAATGLSPVLQNFFSGVQQVASQPTSIPARQALMSAAESLVSRFRSLDQQMSELSQGVNTQLSDAVSNINSYARQIAEINQRILGAQGITNQLPNDLLDQRDQIVTQLNQEIRVTSVLQSDGTTNLFIGNGQPLVVGTQNQQLKVVPDNADISRSGISMVLPGGSTTRLQEAVLTGGRVGGLISFRAQTLDAAQSELGRIAIGVAQAFNEQHRKGQTLVGGVGGDFFIMPPGQVFGTSTPANAGDLSLDVQIVAGSAAELTTSDYQLAYTGGQYTLTRKSDSQAVATGSGFPLLADGFSLNALSGAPAEGDTFLIRPTRVGALNIGLAITDPREIAAAAPLRTRVPLANTGTGTMSAGAVTASGVLANFPVTLTYDAAQGGFSGLPNGTAVTVTPVGGVGSAYTIGPGTPVINYISGAKIAFNGFEASISGSPANGDTFVIEANTGGSGDNRNALALGNLQTMATLLGDASSKPTATFQAAYAQMVSGIGNKGREIQVTQAATENLLKQAQQTQQSISGVNLDEEAANLLRYQQAYQAASKVIEIASKLFDTLLSVTGR